MITKEYTNGIESSEINSQKYNQLTFDKGAKAIKKMEKIHIFQQMVLEKLDIKLQKNESRQTLHPSQKWKWIIDLTVKCKTIKLLEDNIWKSLDDLGMVKTF